jgi:hypothetical protein
MNWIVECWRLHTSLGTLKMQGIITVQDATRASEVRKKDMREFVCLFIHEFADVLCIIV